MTVLLVVRIVFTVVLVLHGVAALWFSAALLRLQYTEHRELWEADGRPIVTFFHPPEVGWGPAAAPSQFAGMAVLFSWMFSAPEWVRDDERASSLLWWARATALVWNLGFFPMVFAWWPAFSALP